MESPLFESMGELIFETVAVFIGLLVGWLGDYRRGRCGRAVHHSEIGRSADSS